MSATCAIPFQLDSTGAIQQVTDNNRALQDRVMALVSTVPGERLMRADYGVPTPNELFDPNIGDLVFAELKLMASQAIRQWEPGAVIVDIQPVINQDSVTVAMNVRVGRADVPNAELNRAKTVLVAVGGSTFDASN
jgi:phage baseplate assembly protein W